MRGAAFLLSLAAIMLPGTAHAADEKTIECVAEHLDPAAAAVIDTASMAFIRSAPDSKVTTPPVAGALDAAAKVCTALHGWSREAAHAAILYATSLKARPAFERAASEFGINPAGFAEVYYKVPLEQRLTIMSGGASGAVFTRIFTEALARHFYPVTEALRAGRYLSVLISLDMARDLFLRS